MSRQIMPSEVFNSIIKSLQNHYDKIPVIVLYHGGEPFLNKNIFKYIVDIRTLMPSSKIKIVTNGNLLNYQKLELLAASTVNEIEFSLDGMSPEESDMVRVNSSSSKVIDAIKTLSKLIKNNKNELKVNVSSTQFISTNADDAFIDPVLQGPTAPPWLVDSLGQYVDDIHAVWAMKWPHMNLDAKKYKEVVYEDESIDTTYLDYCDHPKTAMTIRANGEVVPCCYDLTSQIVLGNVLDNTISEIWNSATYDDFRKSFKSGDQHDLCKSCNSILRNKHFLVKNN